MSFPLRRVPLNSITKPPANLLIPPFSSSLSFLFPPMDSSNTSQRLAALAQQLRLYKPPTSTSDDDDETIEVEDRSNKVASQVGFPESSTPIERSLEKKRSSFNPKKAAVLICLYEGEDGSLRVILTKRSSRLSTHSGEVALPGGKMEEGDKDEAETATREAFEEIGLDPALVNVVTVLQPFLSKHILRVIPVIGILSNKEAFKPVLNPDEVDSIFDAPLEMFLKDENRRVEEREWLGCKYLIHFFDYETNSKRYLIWGLTAGILIRAASVVYQRSPPFLEQNPTMKILRNAANQMASYPPVRLSALAQQLRLFDPPFSADNLTLRLDTTSTDTALEDGKLVVSKGFTANPAKRAAVLICIFEGEDGDLRVILTKRSSKLSSHSGDVALPGGKAEEGDEDDAATALREAKEEIGLNPSLVNVVTVLDPITMKNGMMVVPVVGLLFDEKSFKPTLNADEVEDIFDAPLEMFLKDENRREEEKEWMGTKYLLHLFDYEAANGKMYVIYALTAGFLINAASVVYRRSPAFRLGLPKFWNRNSET